MTWRQELADWLAAGPRPHEPPGRSTSTYAWLRDNGQEILARSKPGKLEKCSVGGCNELPTHRCVTHKVIRSEVREATYYRCARHLMGKATVL